MKYTAQKRQRKAIIKKLDLMIEKYGLDLTRATVTKYFTLIRESKKLQKTIKEREADLSKLRKKILGKFLVKR